MTSCWATCCASCRTSFPTARASLHSLIDAGLDRALDRLAHCIGAVRLWREDEFDPLHSSQYATFLYYLAHTLHVQGADRAVCNKLFLLNKALNGIDLFYEIELPPVFFIGHSVGIVLAKATYGNHLVLYQNCTVGKNHGAAPTLGDGVVMYPHSAIIGNCSVRQRLGAVAGRQRHRPRHARRLPGVPGAKRAAWCSPSPSATSWPTSSATRRPAFNRCAAPARP